MGMLGTLVDPDHALTGRERGESTARWFTQIAAGHHRDGHMNPSGNAPIELVAPTEADAQLVDRWLHADHVRRWWGEPRENSRLLQNLPTGSHRMLIKANSRRVGLIQWQHPSREELDEAGLQDVPTSVIDIDIMVGEPEYTGRGIGTAAIQIVKERALADEAVSYLIAATRIDNVASLRAFEKAGFTVDREFDDPISDRCVLMVLRRQAGGPVSLDKTQSAGKR